MRDRKEQCPWLKDPDRQENWRGELPFDRNEEGYRWRPCDGSMMEAANDRIAQLAETMAIANTDQERAEIIHQTNRAALRLLTAHEYSRRVSNTIQRVGAGRRQKWFAEQDKKERARRQGDAEYGKAYPVHILT